MGLRTIFVAMVAFAGIQAQAEDIDIYLDAKITDINLDYTLSALQSHIDELNRNNPSDDKVKNAENLLSRCVTSKNIIAPNTEAMHDQVLFRANKLIESKPACAPMSNAVKRMIKLDDMRLAALKNKSDAQLNEWSSGVVSNVAMAKSNCIEPAKLLIPQLSTIRLENGSVR